MIVFDCVCGLEIEALDGQAGRKLMCPSCRSDLTVPPRTTAVRPEAVPDLGIDFGPRASVRLNPGRRRSSRPHPLEVLLGGVCRAIGLVAMAAAVLVVAALALGFHRTYLAAGSRVVLVPVAGPPRDYPTGQEERDDADDRARLALAARAEAEEAREGRIRAAAELINPRFSVVASEDTDGGRVQAFLQAYYGRFYTSIVEAGVCRQYAGRDRYSFETGTPENLAQIWASRDRDGAWEVVSATRSAFALTAVVVDRTRARRWRLGMAGFDAAGEAVIEMRPLD